MIGAAENRALASERAFSEVKRLAAAGLEAPELLLRVTEWLKRAVPSAVSSAVTLDPASNLVTHLLSTEEGEARDAFLGRVYFEEDLPRVSSAVRERRTVQLLSESAGGKLDRSMRYRELLRPRGLGNELNGLFVDGAAWGAIGLMRETKDREFRSGEAALLGRIAPHVGAGLKAASLRARASAPNGETRAPGVLTLDLSGNVVSHIPSAERWLGDLEDLRPDWREGGLPVAVTMVREALRRSLSPQAERDGDRVPRVRVKARSGRWLTLYASLTEPSHEHPGEAVVVVEPTRPEEVAWLNATAYGLSPREEEVVGLVVRGLSNREISRSLSISENTVQRHLQNAFEKAGVRSRTELLKRLFFEHLLPGMLGR